jgi:hypothetical protein
LIANKVLQLITECYIHGHVSLEWTLHTLAIFCTRA